MRWDSTSASDEPMLFDGARAEAERFLRAVDDLRRLAPPSPAAVGARAGCRPGRRRSRPGWWRRGDRRAGRDGAARG